MRRDDAILAFDDEVVTARCDFVQVHRRTVGLLKDNTGPGGCDAFLGEARLCEAVGTVGSRLFSSVSRAFLCVDFSSYDVFEAIEKL